MYECTLLKLHKKFTITCYGSIQHTIMLPAHKLSELMTHFRRHYSNNETNITELELSPNSALY